MEYVITRFKMEDKILPYKCLRCWYKQIKEHNDE